jgi:Rad3-related DNA helicase
MTDPLEFFKRYSITPRPQQIDVLSRVSAEWDKKKYFVLNCPTGTGKTYIATAIADSIHNSFVLTSTLLLQDQYEKSWDEMVNLKGRSNYRCGVNSSFTVDAAPCTLKKSLAVACKKQCICPYYNQKNAAIRSKTMLTNPLFMLYSAHCGFATEDSFSSREALIIDECHMLEGQLISFAESDIDPQKIQQTYGITLSDISFGQNEYKNIEALSMIRNRIKAELDDLKAELAHSFPDNGDENLQKWAKALGNDVASVANVINKKIYSLDKVLQPINIFFDTRCETNKWIVAKHHDKNVLKLSPFSVDFIFNKYFAQLAEKFVFMSATMPPKAEFCKEFGISEAECLYIDIDSPFDPELSPITVVPCLDLSKKNFEKNITSVGSIIDSILAEHKNEKGIIHSVTYTIASEIYSQVSDENKSRLVSRDGFTNRKKVTNAELLEIHERNENSVLLSPSMMEGVDLKDDLARFQIVMKLPWPSLGDIRIAKKMQLDQEWYNCRMWLQLVQASGRSTRHDKDTSVTYILDKNFAYFYRNYKHKLPAWFNKRITIL